MTINDNYKRLEAVENAYNKLASERSNWQSKYDINYQIMKMLCDYALLSRLDMVGKRVLNIGCFEPIDEVFWASIISEWHAIDINREAIEMAQRLASEALPAHLYSKLKFAQADVTELNSQDGFYDIVLCFSTIDHIPGDDKRKKAISEMCRVLKPGGHLVITVPNRWDLYYSYYSNKLQKQGTAIFGYEYQFSPLELKKMLKSNGLIIVDCVSTAFNPYSYFDRILRKLKLAKMKIYFGTRFGFLAQKR